MVKIQNISEIHPTLGFTEFDVLEKYRKSFNESELGRLYSVFPFACMAKAAGLSEQHPARRNIFSPSDKIALMVLKAYTGFSDRHLVQLRTRNSSGKASNGSTDISAGIVGSLA